MPRKHNTDLHEQAFQLYLQGKSQEEIARLLGIAKSTIARWAKDTSPEFNWTERARKIRERVRTLSDKKLADRLTRLYEEIDSLRAEVLAEIGHTQWRSKEGAIAAARSLTELLLKLQPEQNEIKSQTLNAVFGVLFSDPVLGPVLERRKEILMEKINQVLSNA
ncbi:MAG: helix-turn-helix domain-containing protein [candidate division WOR-3 bacterium]|nr:helix-turn-helix domain-containing protein [candidate division WOR-3 bacterium]